MSARYLFFRNPHAPSQDEGEEGVLHARVVQGQVLRFDDLCERIAGRSTFTSGEVKGLMTLFQEELVSSLKNGDPVEVDGIGSFYVTAKCPPIHDSNEIRAESIHFSRVVFRACKELKREMSTMRFERASDFRKPNAYTAEQRQQRILRFLVTNREISSSRCMGLNHCSRYLAQGDLKELRKQGQVIRLGGPKVAIYVLPDKEETI